MESLIPVSEPALGERELELVSECVKGGWISSSGRFIDEFELRWAALCGMEQGIAVSSGTAALEVAIACLLLKPGDEVILPTFTIISCATAILRCGAKPVLVDSDPATWCIDVNQVAGKITPRTRAIMPVHIYGHPVDMDPLSRLAAEYGLDIVEDAAEAHGAEYLGGRDGAASRWRRCGGLGDLAAFSFYANKPITTGEGGMVLTNDPVWAERARSFRNLCFRRDRRFLHTEMGNNYRLTNMQAALGLAQLERFDEIVRRKRWIGQQYNARLQGTRGLQLPVEMPWARSVYWMYGIVLDDGVDADAAQLARRLLDVGVETRPFFLGLHEQPALLDMGLFRGESYPVAERLARRGLYLPSGLKLTGFQLDHVCRSLQEILH